MTTTPNPTAERWRKKPVEIEAMRITSTAMHEAILEEWSGGAVRYGSVTSDASGRPASGYVTVETLEGTMRGNLGDWIIRGVRGEFYPCERSIFEETYEPAGLLSEGAPSKEQVERAALAIYNRGRQSAGQSPVDRLPWSPRREGVIADARAALTAAGVAPQEPSEELRIEEDYSHIYWRDPLEGCWVAYRRADCVGEEELPPTTLAAQPVLDPEKVAAELLRLMREEAMLVENGTEEWIAESDPVECLPPLARALCEAAKRGELT